MKIVRIFGIVLAVHVVMLLVFFQPGCQSKPRPAPEQTGSVTTATGPDENLEWESPDYTSSQIETVERPRATPTRPSTSRAERSSRSSSVDSEPLKPLPSSNSTSSSTSTSRSTAPSSTASSSGVYTVERGDNLSVIAQRNNVSLGSLLSINGLTMKSVIRPGQELLIPAGGSASTPSTSSSSTSSQPKAAPAGTETYKVARGDSLSRIAQRHGTTISDLKDLNNLSSDVIRVDQTLIVPEAGSAPRAPAKAESSSASSSAGTGNGEVHVVKSGETPGGIASRYGISVDELMQANNVSDPRRMQIGQKLTIPGQAAQASAPKKAPAKAEPAPAPKKEPEAKAREPRPVQVLPSDAISEDEFPIIPVLPEGK